MAKGSRKGGRGKGGKGSKGGRKGGKGAPKSKHIPLNILEKRLGKLNKVVKDRGGNAWT